MRALLALLLLTSTAFAQEWEDAKLGHVVRDTGFSSSELVVAAYSFIWLVLLLYVAALWVRGNRVARELSDLRKAIDARKG